MIVPFADNASACPTVRTTVEPAETDTVDVPKSTPNEKAVEALLSTVIAVLPSFAVAEKTTSSDPLTVAETLSAEMLLKSADGELCRLFTATEPPPVIV